MRDAAKSVRKAIAFCALAACVAGLVCLSLAPAAWGANGLANYYVTDWPEHLRDDMEAEAAFNLQPDAGSVRLLLTPSSGQAQTVYPADVDYEGGYWIYDFDFYVTEGTWTPTLYWSVGGTAYNAAQASFTISATGTPVVTPTPATPPTPTSSDVSNPTTPTTPSTPPASGALEGYTVTDWPEYLGDDMEITAIFTLQPDAGSLRLVLTPGSGQAQRVYPTDVDYEGGRWVYDFDFYVTQGTWTPTLYWSVGGTAYSAAQSPFTIGVTGTPVTSPTTPTTPTTPTAPTPPSAPSTPVDPPSGGFEGYAVTDWPDYQGDDVETNAVFSAQPDTGTVRLVLTSNSGGTQTFYPEEVDYENGRWIYDFKLYLGQGTWTPTLHWAAGGVAYSAAQSPFTIGGSTAPTAPTTPTTPNSNNSGNSGGGGGCNAGGLSALTLLGCLPALLGRRGR